MAGSCIVAAPTLPTNALDKSSGELYGVIDFPAVGSLGRLGAAWSRAHKFGFDLAPSDGGKQLARQLEFVFDDTRCPRSVLLDDLYLQVGPCSILLSSSTLQYEKYLVPSSSIAEYAAAEAANGWSRISWLSSGAALLRLPVRALVLPVALALLPSAASRTACTIPTHLTTTTTTLHPPNAASSVADPTTPAITIAHYQRQGKLLCAHPCCLIRPQYVVHGSLSWGRGKKGGGAKRERQSVSHTLDLAEGVERVEARERLFEAFVGISIPPKAQDIGHVDNGVRSSPERQMSRTAFCI
ncbi:hypothetical protein B0H17DRAFT_1140899 [Mycena rosella]|uniref:Uncharacterized protein n=1 Tax=Mycena rosella TaxID=1033263 RepID=A0AAD7D0Q7_MYCRO|nr:hypothetical protein B0H17DRAFT_1140899 [Mycena rosella]